MFLAQVLLGYKQEKGRTSKKRKKQYHTNSAPLFHYDRSVPSRYQRVIRESCPTASDSDVFYRAVITLRRGTKNFASRILDPPTLPREKRPPKDNTPRKRIKARAIIKIRRTSADANGAVA